MSLQRTFIHVYAAVQPTLPDQRTIYSAPATEGQSLKLLHMHISVSIF